MDLTTLIEIIEKKLEITTLPKETKELVTTKLGENILERTNLSVAELLTEDDASLVAAMIKEGELEEVMSFLSKKYPELDHIVILHCNNVLTEFLGKEVSL